MATMHRIFIFATCFVSGLGVLFSVISIATQQWVFSNKISSNLTQDYQTVKYGLFGGTFRMTYPIRSTTEITMTCLAKENICAVIYGRDAEERHTLLKNIYNVRAVDHDSSRKFINCDMWISTIIFLVTSTLFGLISSLLSFYNTVYNPIELYLSVYSLFIYNGIALLSVIMAMILWGSLFITRIYYDVAIECTLVGICSSDKNAKLGYSYWLNIIPIVCYVASICILFVRQYIISKDPLQKIVQREEAGDPVIYLY